MKLVVYIMLDFLLLRGYKPCVANISGMLHKPFMVNARGKRTEVKETAVELISCVLTVLHTVRSL